MTPTLFTADWTFHREGDLAGSTVRLPHDAMIGETRTATGGTDNHGGYFPGGRYVYRKRWTAPEDADHRSYKLSFEGVYGITYVVVNGTEMARSNSPYRRFDAPLGDLKPGTEALIEVHVDNSSVPNSRWYTGSGIYRPVWLYSLTDSRIAEDGVRIVTRDIRTDQGSSDASVQVSVRLDGPAAIGSTVVLDIHRGGQRVLREERVASGGIVVFDTVIHGAALWSAEEPNLYEVSVMMGVDGEPIDEYRTRTGLRMIDVDSSRGLRINGQEVLLRGTAVHHDNGILGAATFDAAEWRRARILKEAGFNAVRSAHNPLSRAFLDACDTLGLYVMDELTDVWFRRKTPHDGAPQFHESWADDAAAMISEDRNRPSVIMYSIGNEIAESAAPSGIRVAQQITAYFHAADATRPTTIAVNPLLAMMASRDKSTSSNEVAPPERKPATSTAANQMAARIGRMMVLASMLPAADRATRGVFDAVDIAGYNYGYAAYPRARRRYPDRVIVGTESMPGDLPAIWKRVTSTPGVIGDFSWTGWDYLGEVGLGYWSYGTEPGGIAKPYPGILAGCGIFDITGAPTGTLSLVQAVWNVTEAPGIAVRPLDRVGQRPNKTPWLSTDAVPSWSWGRHSGTAEIEVYSAGDHIELQLNGRSLGRRRAGRKTNYKTRFAVPYEPGELTAIAYTAGAEIGRRTLRSARNVDLRLRAEIDELHGPDDLAFVWIELADADGIVDFGSEDEVTVHVSGPATLAALGSAAPTSDRSYLDDSHPTYRGRALAIVRPTGLGGEITIRATSRQHGVASLILQASPAVGDTSIRTPLTIATGTDAS